MVTLDLTDTQRGVLLGITRERNLRSKIRWFTEFCNSHYVSHFAAFFIVTRTKISIVNSCSGMGIAFTTPRNYVSVCKTSSLLATTPLQHFHRRRQHITRTRVMPAIYNLSFKNRPIACDKLETPTCQECDGSRLWVLLIMTETTGIASTDPFTGRCRHSWKPEFTLLRDAGNTPIQS